MGNLLELIEAVLGRNSVLLILREIRSISEYFSDREQLDTFLRFKADFLDLCKNANSLQKKNIIQIVEDTQKELEEELDEEIRKKRMIELKQKVKEILIKG